MRTVELSEAKQSLEEYIREMDGEPIILTENGEPVAALVPIEGADLETILVGTNPDFVDFILRARQRHAREDGIPAAEVRRRLGCS